MAADSHGVVIGTISTALELCAPAACFYYTVKMSLSMEMIKKRSSDLDCCHRQQGIIFRGPRKERAAEQNERSRKADLCSPISILT